VNGTLFIQVPWKIKLLDQSNFYQISRDGLLQVITQLHYCIIGRRVSSMVKVKDTIGLEETLLDNPAECSPECDSSQYHFKLQSRSMNLT
jgi:hypothetical protein